MANYTLNGYKWGSSATLGTAGGTVTWAFDNTVPANFFTDINDAFNDWQAYGNIQFQNIASTATANIVFTYGAFDGPGNVAGQASTSFTNTGIATHSNIIIDNAEGWHTSGTEVVTTGNTRLEIIVAHEIGHAIGLGHYNTDPAVMNATLSSSINNLLAPDIAGVQAIYGAACYASGTLIRTDRGETAVEKLRIGDIVVTAGGAQRPIRWIGHRTLDLTKHPKPEAVWPIRVERSAFGPAKPVRDLWLSPAHAVFANGVLVQIERLVNGATIRQVPRDEVTYWHIELDSHDIILAEGLEAETYLDTGNRNAFVEAGPVVDMHPDFRAKAVAETCAPLVETGPQLAAIKDALLRQAEALGHEWTDECGLHVLADGVRIDAAEKSGRRVVFDLPAATDIRLVSKTWTPAQATAAQEDYRALGVEVWRLTVDGAVLPLALVGEGWHDLEIGGHHAQRWTTGDTPLPRGCRRIVVDFNAKGLYLADRRRFNRSAAAV